MEEKADDIILCLNYFFLSKKVFVFRSQTIYHNFFSNPKKQVSIFFRWTVFDFSICGFLVFV